MRARRIALPAVFVVLSVAPWVVGSRYVFHVATMITLTIPLALSLNLTMRIGQLSLAQPAFMGIGAYCGAVLAMQMNVPPLLAVLAGGLLASLVALATGSVFLRIKGVYFVLLTYAFGEIVNLIFQYWTAVTGGNNGLYGVPKFSVLGLRPGAVTGGNYLLGLAVAVGFFLLVYAFEKSDAGTICEALNEDEMLCRSIGSNAHAWRVAAFVLSAFMAGTTGGFYAFYIGFISPDSFGFTNSVDLIVMNVIGGPTAVIGPVIGTLIVVPLLELLRDVRQYQLLVYGICLIVFVMFCRQGLVPLLRRYLARRHVSHA